MAPAQIETPNGLVQKPGMLIDSHCHLNYPGLVEQQDAVVERAHAAGVGAMISISTRRNEWADVIAGAMRHPGVFASIGVHPHEADSHPEVDAATLVEATRSEKVIGIGETGLDYHYSHSSHEQQRRLFRAHIVASRETGLPLIVHTRDAEDDSIAILGEEMAEGAFPILIHCFTGTARLAEACLALGAYISISGIVTFKKALELQEVAKNLPADRILVETDSPFLAPVPLRGKTCEPAFVAHTARFLAGLRGVPYEELQRTTAANTRELFRKAEFPCG